MLARVEAVSHATNGADRRGPVSETQLLAQVVDVHVGAAFETADARLELILGSQQQYRRRHATLAQLGDNTEPVAAGKHDVEHHTAEAAVERTFQRAIARIGFRHAVSLFAKRFSEEPAQITIVFDQQDLHVANLRRRAGVRQCEKDEKALRKSSTTTAAKLVLSH